MKLEFAKSKATLKKNQIVKFKYIPTGIGVVLGVNKKDKTLTLGTVFKQRGEQQSLHKSIVLIKDIEIYKDKKEVPNYIVETYLKFIQ